ncbi:hypothetical protein MNBD_ALPHA04-1692 [hydrothermal vent metagenome]|uniref:Uncharacterized protein n=1 Tax=hydrothermal vent metagenome TaxID=652676 RepID=A0A3B0TAD1_9ZZZZ
MSMAEFSGNLRERIRIERQAADRDALGSASEQSILIGEFWAAAKTVGTGSGAEAESRSALPRWRFTLRQTDLILPGDKIAWGNRKMMIRSVSLEHRPTPKTILLAEEKR